MVRGTLPLREGMALYSLVLQGAAYWLRAATPGTRGAGSPVTILRASLETREPVGLLSI